MCVCVCVCVCVCMCVVVNVAVVAAPAITAVFEQINQNCNTLKKIHNIQP